MSYLYILFTIIMFSTLEVTGKIIGPSISPYSITLYRFVIGGFFMLPFAINELRKSKQQLKIKDFSLMGIPGIVNVSISMMFLQLAIHYGKAGVSAILISANPIFVTIFAVIILKEKTNLIKILGLFIGITGVILIINQEINSFSEAINPTLGVIFGLISSISFGLYTVLSKKFVKEYGNILTNTVAFFIGSFVLAVVCIFLNYDLSFNPTTNNLIFIGYLGIFISGIAYLTYFHGLKKVDAAKGSMLFFLKPVIASILAFLFFQEKLTNLQLVGVIIILLGISCERIYNKLFSNKAIQEK